MRPFVVVAVDAFVGFGLTTMFALACGICRIALERQMHAL
jgi:hypothetical protein